MAIQDWRSLQKMLDEKQKGITDENPYVLQRNPGETDSDYAKRWEAAFNPDRNGYAQRKQGRVAFHENYTPVSYAETITPGEAYNLGYGKDEKRDLAIPFDEWIKNPQEYRANAQSAGSQLANGILKMVPYAASTFIDNTAGLLGGLYGLFTSEHTFVDNPVSRAMQEIREWSDEVMPNYRTEEEMNDQDRWWKHLNANFWGDSFMKNLGFTIGAGLSGAKLSGWASDIYNVLGPSKKLFNAPGKLVNKAYKAAVSASKKSDAAAVEAFRNVLRGGGVDVDNMYNTFSKIQKAYNKEGAIRNFVGSVGAAVGESRTEALQAAKEFHDSFVLQAKEDMDRATQELQRYITSNEDFLTTEPVYDGFGNQVGERTVVNEDGRRYYEQQMAELQKEYDYRVSQAEAQGENLATNVFWMNMPLLAASNAVMFGRMFSGGFRSQAKASVKGGLEQGYRSIGYTGRGAVKAAEKTLSEGFEELFQKVFSEGAKNAANRNMAAFHNGKYDPEALADTSTWLMRSLASTGGVLSDASSWQEFAIGALTGGLGMPARGGWAGGIAGAIQENRDEIKASQEAAQKLNETIANTDFKTFFNWMTRDKALENIKDQALKDNDKFVWHGANDAQMLNYVMSFARAGRLNDLEDMVDAMADMDSQDISDIKSTFLDINDPDVQNMKDSEVEANVEKRVKEIKEAINQYRDVRESLDLLALGTTDPDVLDELTFTKAQMQNFEKRYTNILNGVLEKIRPTLVSASAELDRNGNPTERAKKASHLLESSNNLQTLFGDYAIDIERRGQDKDTNPAASIVYALNAEKRKQVMKDLEDLGVFAEDKVTKEEVNDLTKLIDSRQNYYAKFFSPTFRQGFEASKTSEEKMTSTLKKDARAAKVDEFMNRLSSVKSRKEFMNTYNSFDLSDDTTANMLNERIEKDPNLKKYIDTNKAAEDFGKSLEESIKSKPDGSAKDEVVKFFNEYDLNNLLISMPDNADPAVVMAQDMLDSFTGSQEAQDMLRSILIDKLGNKAQSISSGTVPQANPQANQEPQSETQQQQESDYDKLDKRITNAVSLGNMYLKDILAGNFSKYGNFTEEEKQNLFNQALQKEKELKEARGMVATSDDEAAEKASIQDVDSQPIDSPQRRTANEEFKRKDTKTVRGSQFSFWDIPSLVKGIVRRFTSKKPGVNDTMNWYDAHHVQQFIDSGALALLEEHYKSKGERLPIYFLGNPHFVEGNTALNPFATEKTKNVVFAIEMNKENRDLLSRHEKAGIFTDSTLIEAEGKKYQVLGVMPDYAATLDFEEAKADPESYERSVNEAGSMWEATMQNSILPQYQADTANGGDVNFPREGKWYIAKSDEEPISTTINYISSGRNETRVEGGDYTRLSVKESLNEYEALGEKVHFALAKDPLSQDPIVTTPGAPEFPRSINTPPGSLWMATKEANGQWAWTYITVARTNEFDFEANKNSRIVKRIDHALGILFEKVNTSDVAQRQGEFDAKLRAIKSLEDMIYLGANNKITFEILPDGNVHAYIGNLPCDNAEQAMDILKKNNYRFQVDTQKVEQNDLKDLVDTGILRTEMRSFVRKGASFGVNYLSERDNQGDTAFTPGQTASSQDNQGRGDIRIEDTGYTVMPDGTVYTTGANGSVGEQVQDQGLIAQVKAVQEAMDLMDPNPADAEKPYLKQRHSDEWFALYPGKGWRIETDKEYTELFEREIDGIKVHMIKRGENGAILPLYDDAEWNQLVSSAEEVGVHVQEEQPEASQPEKPSPKKLTGSLKSRLMKSAKKAKDSSAPTVQQNDQNESKKEDEIDCG